MLHPWLDQEWLMFAEQWLNGQVPHDAVWHRVVWGQLIVEGISVFYGYGRYIT